MSSRYFSDIVTIGNLPLGGSFPIRVQSMTNTDTNNIKDTVEQCERLYNAGCEMIRITAQGITEANNLSIIKKQLAQRGIRIPLIADIHFNPAAAEVAAAIVEKVRINPGNYSDKRSRAINLSQSEYNEELERIAERLQPLLNICRSNGTAIRIGTNHGSLSGRIVDRYGDTVEGMVESALEFGRICKAAAFSNVVFSMKSSNVRVMVQATRLLAEQMKAEGMKFPLHLGVTEAGDGEDGIIKSAAGIGTLLEEGIGDTIRVSLTGAPEIEIPVALAITQRFNPSRLTKSDSINTVTRSFEGRKASQPVAGIGTGNPVAVIALQKDEAFVVNEQNKAVEKISLSDLQKLAVIEGNAAELHKKAALINSNQMFPLVLKHTYHADNLLRFQIDSAIDFGSMLIDGFGDAIWPVAPAFAPEVVNHTAFAILQATRARITRTEYISCPSCGRTLFDIEKTLQEVKVATAQYTGLKIAVMGCIVNGPGEMADADFGYVGAGKGLVTLYKGKDVIRKNVPEADAIKVLLESIELFRQQTATEPKP